MKSIKEIVDETVAYYSEDVNRRNFNYKISQCMYYTDGKMCAVGRCLENPQSFEDYDKGSTALFETYGFDILKEEYRGHSADFWDELQELHDTDSYWNTKGLNDRGLEYADYIISNYSTPNP